MFKIGIILVNYNGVEDTIDCIRSIYKSKFTNYFIIVIDNDSREDSSILRNFEKVVYKKLYKNVGFGVANNIGADIALDYGATHILCLNNDTIIESDTLSVLLANSSKKKIVTAATYYYSQKDKLWYGGGEISKIKGTFKHKKYKTNRKISFICGCCMLVPADCIYEIGLFEKEYFMYYEDADFSLKAQANGYMLYYVSNTKVFHKVGKSTDKIPGLREYYLTRNRLYILNKYRSVFKITAIPYFWVTRFLMILKNLLLRRNIMPFIDGIKDFKHDKMGEKSESV